MPGGVGSSPTGEPFTYHRTWCPNRLQNDRSKFDSYMMRHAEVV